MYMYNGLIYSVTLKQWPALYMYKETWTGRAVSHCILKYIWCVESVCSSSSLSLNWHLHYLILDQMLAFSLLDSIIAVDWQHRWLNYLNLKGYLKHMVEGLAHEDHMLQSMLDPSPEPLKVMLLFWTLNWKYFYANNMTCSFILAAKFPSTLADISFAKTFGQCEHHSEQSKRYFKAFVKLRCFLKLEYFDFLANCLHFHWAGDRVHSYHCELWKTSCSAQVVVAVIKKLVHTLSCMNIEIRMRTDARALKKLELVTLLSCSPNPPRAPITRYSHARNEPILYWNSSPIDAC